MVQQRSRQALGIGWGWQVEGGLLPRSLHQRSHIPGRIRRGRRHQLLHCLLLGCFGARLLLSCTAQGLSCRALLLLSHRGLPAWRRLWLRRWGAPRAVLHRRSAARTSRLFV